MWHNLGAGKDGNFKRNEIHHIPVQRTLYTYRKNLLGDIIAVYQGSTKVAEYAYDAYGKCTVILNTAGIATINPFRYRSSAVILLAIFATQRDGATTLRPFGKGRHPLASP